MQKLVVLKLDGGLVEGVRVTLEIGAEGERATTEVRGNLPPSPEMVTHYDRWQSTYRSLEDFRITPIGISIGGDRTSQLNKCRFLGDELSKHLNSWLNSASFRPLKEKLLKQLTPDDTVRVLIKTDDIWLRRLPWHLWNFFEDYSKAEVALSAPEYEHLPSSKIATSKDKVKILAILGNSEGISIEKDRELLEKLPDAAPTFLVEPKRSQLSEQLWEQDWDILFFAGHSSSQETGQILLNQTDAITLEQLRHALKKAIERGLRLAIFNSCDGLDLAQQLADLQIGQVIVMREPVPDVVAQAFLRYFLTAFSSGKSLCTSVREARERLQGLEEEYPYATWLPVIYQNPTEVPLTWQELCSVREHGPTTGIAKHCKGFLSKVLMVSVVVTTAIIGARQLGLLQVWELHAFDHLMRLRPLEEPDNRLLVVEVTEEDISRYHHPLADETLALLLEKLEQYQPRVIGLNIYRNRPEGRGYSRFVTQLQQNVRLVVVCKVGEDNDPAVSPPSDSAVILVDRLGFTDVVVDRGNTVRRHLLLQNSDDISPCDTPNSLSFQLALHYLDGVGIQPKLIKGHLIKWGRTVLKPLEANTGGYKGVDAQGYQVMLNYRRTSKPIARTVTLTNVLTDQIDPNWVKDRIVLIGVTAPSVKDNFSTPFGQQKHQQIRGLLLQAQMVSQIVSAVEDGRSLLWTWSFWGEALWIWSWSLIGGVLVWRWRSPLILGLAGTAALATLYGLCFILLTWGSWVPLVPSALVLIATGGSIVVYVVLRI